MSLRTHPTRMASCYRPQHSCGKVKFSQASVIMSTGGVCQTPPWADAPRQTPRWANGYCSKWYALADPRGGARDARPPWGPNSFIFMQFSAKNWKIIELLGVGAPPWGKSWIRHWYASYWHAFLLFHTITAACLKGRIITPAEVVGR